MTWICLSTSSAKTSVALFRDATLIASRSEEGKMRATELTFAMLDSLFASNDLTVGDIDLFVADVGPGSFTGVKVGVTIVKTLAFAANKRVAGVLSLDLISRDEPAMVSIRRDVHVYRESADAEPTVLESPEDGRPQPLGYGPWTSDPVYPDAVNAAEMFDSLRSAEPDQLVPQYFALPGISTPRKPYGGVSQ